MALFFITIINGEIPTSGFYDIVITNLLVYYYARKDAHMDSPESECLQQLNTSRGMKNKTYKT